MNTTSVVLIVVIVLLLVALVGALLARRRRSAQLQDRYGPEYERTLNQTGDRRATEQELAGREKRHRSLEVRDLQPEERDRFAAAWTDVQRGFVDDPVQAVGQADALVTDIMRTRGYPVDDFDRRAEDVSVEHPQVVSSYREARAIHDSTQAGSADTEQQRHAVTSYRELIDALLGREPNGRHALHQPSDNHVRTTEMTPTTEKDTENTP